jgi:hypothetical protein
MARIAIQQCDIRGCMEPPERATQHFGATARDFQYARASPRGDLGQCVCEQTRMQALSAEAAIHMRDGAQRRLNFLRCTVATVQPLFFHNSLHTKQ